MKETMIILGNCAGKYVDDVRLVDIYNDNQCEDTPEYLKRYAKLFGITTFQLYKLVNLRRSGATDLTIEKRYVEYLEYRYKQCKMADSLKIIRIVEQEAEVNLATALRISYKDIQAFERGEKRPEAAMIKKYAKYFGIKVKNIYDLCKMETSGKSFVFLLQAYLQTKR